MRSATEIIGGVRETEKSTRVARHGQYIVDVAIDANKIEIRRAVAELFHVNVRKVTSVITQGKWRRLQARRGKRPDRKKAIVTLEKGQKIEVKT